MLYLIKLPLINCLLMAYKNNDMQFDPARVYDKINLRRLIAEIAGYCWYIK